MNSKQLRVAPREVERWWKNAGVRVIFRALFTVFHLTVFLHSYINSADGSLDSGKCGP